MSSRIPAPADATVTAELATAAVSRRPMTRIRNTLKYNKNLIYVKRKVTLKKSRVVQRRTGGCAGNCARKHKVPEVNACAMGCAGSSQIQANCL